MKKIVLSLIAFILALPVLSYAGSATSRWDMTIGGYVKFDMGYATQGQGQDLQFAQRQGYGAYDNLTDKYGTFYTYAGETRLNFRVNGPDAWGAKTWSFVEGDFRGQSSSGAGTFTLRHAFMTFEWPQSKLIIGQTYQKWGLLPTYANTILGYNDIAPFLKGQRQPMIRFEQGFAKNWNWSFAVMSPSNTLGANGATYGTVDSYTRSQMPFFEGTFGWSSDKCGNIGPWKMLFALEGFYGQQKQTIGLYTGTLAAMTSLKYTDKDVDAWGISIKGFVPVIPEKKGNKQGALSLSGILFYTQNPGWLQNGTTYSPGSYASTTYGSSVDYQSASTATPDFASPKVYGGWGQASYFFTDKLYISGWYGYLRNNASSAYAAKNVSVIQNTSQYILNLSYDVNAAIRLGVEYGYYVTRYMGYTTTAGVINGDKDGTLQSYRVGAWYFF
jgi:hypothetical protein